MRRYRHDYLRARRRQTLFFTITAGIMSVVLLVGLILFCYHSNHLHI